MELIRFLKPRNVLESWGRPGAPKSAGGGEERSCPNCRRTTGLDVLKKALMVCDCGHHFRLSARERIELLCGETFTELFRGLTLDDPLCFPGYPEKLSAARQGSGEEEAVLCGEGEIGDGPCCLFVMEPAFMMASMGGAVGEKITRLFEHALEKRLPVVGCTASGGARMQEGLISLMQMAKVSAAVGRHGAAGLLYIVLLTDPTTGGVTASFAMQGDITLAEPGATVGFAGARVIEQTTRKSLPKGFQSAEFLLQRGFIDSIVARDRQKDLLGWLLRLHEGGTADGISGV